MMASLRLSHSQLSPLLLSARRLLVAVPLSLLLWLCLLCGGGNVGASAAAVSGALDGCGVERVGQRAQLEHVQHPHSLRRRVLRHPVVHSVDERVSLHRCCRVRHRSIGQLGLPARLRLGQRVRRHSRPHHRAARPLTRSGAAAQQVSVTHTCAFISICPLGLH